MYRRFSVKAKEVFLAVYYYGYGVKEYAEMNGIAQLCSHRACSEQKKN